MEMETIKWAAIAILALGFLVMLVVWNSANERAKHYKNEAKFCHTKLKDCNDDITKANARLTRASKSLAEIEAVKKFDESSGNLISINLSKRIRFEMPMSTELAHNVKAKTVKSDGKVIGYDFTVRRKVKNEWIDLNVRPYLVD